MRGKGCVSMGSAIPRVEVFECGADLGFPIYAYNRRATKFRVITHKVLMRVFRVSHAIAFVHMIESRGLSAIANCLVTCVRSV